MGAGPGLAEGLARPLSAGRAVLLATAPAGPVSRVLHDTAATGSREALPVRLLLDDLREGVEPARCRRQMRRRAASPLQLGQRVFERRGRPGRRAVCNSFFEI